MIRSLQAVASSVARRLLTPWLIFLGFWAGIVAGSAPLFLTSPERTEWAWVYRRAALRMQAGEPVNVIEPVAYSYPPAMAMLTVPLSNCSPRLGAVGWLAVNSAALAVLMVACWRLCGGPRPFSPISGGWMLVFAGAMLLNLRYTIAPLQHQQFDLVIAALVVGGCWALGAGRKVAAGISLGAATAMKCTPLLFFPWLLWRRQWLPAALLLAVGFGLNLLPDVLFPQQNGRLYVQDWLESFAAAPARHGPGEWFTEPSQNQSLSGTMARWFGRSESAILPSKDDRRQPENGGAVSLNSKRLILLRALVYGTDLLLILVTLAACGRPFQPLGLKPVEQPNENSTGDRSWPGPSQSGRRQWPHPTLQLAVEASAVCCLMLLLSPMTGKAHFVLMLLPCFVLIRAALIDQDRRLWPVIGLMAIAGPLTTKGVWGRDLGGAMLDWGMPTLYLALGLAGSWLAVRHVDQPVMAGEHRSP